MYVCAHAQLHIYIKAYIAWTMLAAETISTQQRFTQSNFMLFFPPFLVVMTTSQFARIPQYNPVLHQAQFVGVSAEERGQSAWEHTGGGFPSHAINGLIHTEFDDQEYVIANGHSISPATPKDSDVSLCKTEWGVARSVSMNNYVMNSTIKREGGIYITLVFFFFLSVF